MSPPQQEQPRAGAAAAICIEWREKAGIEVVDPEINTRRLQFAIRFPPPHDEDAAACSCIQLIAERHLIDPDLPSAHPSHHHCCPSGIPLSVSVMGSCVSKKAARAGAGGKGKVAAPLPVAEKESAHHAHQLPPVLEVEAEVEVEEVKEVVLSETPAPRPPRPPTPPEPVKRRKAAEQPEAVDEAAAAASETCSASDSAASVASSAAKAKPLHRAAGGEREVEVEKRAVDAPEKAKTTARRTPAPEERESRKHKGGGNGHGRARSPSPSSAHRRQQQQSGGQGQQHHPPPAPRPRPAVVSGIGCRSGRFSPSAARRAAESAAAVRRTHSAREADMALPSSSSSKRCLSLNGNVAAGHGGGSGSSAALCSRRDPGERSGRWSESPTGGSRRAPASPSPSAAIQRPASPMRNKAAAKERHGTPERARPPPRAALGGGVGGEQRKVAEGAPLGHNNPSVAMECFIFL